MESQNQTSIVDMINTAKNLELTEGQMEKNAVLTVIVTKEGADTEEHEAKLTCVVQGKSELLINGLVNAMKQDSQLEAIFKEAIKRSTPILRLMMAMLESLNKDLQDSEEAEQTNDAEGSEEQTKSSSK